MPRRIDHLLWTLWSIASWSCRSTAMQRLSTNIFGQINRQKINKNYLKQPNSTGLQDFLLLLWFYFFLFLVFLLFLWQRKKNIIFTFLLSYFAFLHFSSPNWNSSLFLPIGQRTSISIHHQFNSPMSHLSGFRLILSLAKNTICCSTESSAHLLISGCLAFKPLQFDEKQLTVRRSRRISRRKRKEKKIRRFSKSVGQTLTLLCHCWIEGECA